MLQAAQHALRVAERSLQCWRETAALSISMRDVHELLASGVHSFKVRWRFVPLHDVISLGCWAFTGCLISIEFLVKFSRIRNSNRGDMGEFPVFLIGTVVMWILSILKFLELLKKRGIVFLLILNVQ